MIGVESVHGEAGKKLTGDCGGAAMAGLCAWFSWVSSLKMLRRSKKALAPTRVIPIIKLCCSAAKRTKTKAPGQRKFGSSSQLNVVHPYR
jgi:hypothetical protein